MGLDVGSRVAQYRLERLLGAGGMGEVYLAHDTRLDRRVAIKFLNAPTDERSRRRLLREARAIAGLDHPGICGVHEVGTDPAGGDFIAMQYVEGETLASRLRRGRMKPDEALAVAAHIAEALIAAHRRGMVHRDLKPQNIILTPSGLPKLLDFGLATHVPLTSEAANAITSSHITNPGAIVGTPGYMAPEQIRNEPVDFRADVFALGCVLYECLTGRRAFGAPTVAETLGEILHVEPVPPSELVPGMGPVYDGLCARMLQKDPAQRFQSAEEVLGAIRAMTPSGVASAAGRATASGPRAPRRAQWGTAAVLLLSGAIAATVWPRDVMLPTPPADAVVWFDRGVEAMHDGTYASARDAFAEAVRIFPDYAQAYSRLAEAHTAFEDERQAQAALLEVSRLVPDRSRLPEAERWRFEAATASALRRHAQAVEMYRALADAAPEDARRLLDVGRAQEAASRNVDARATYVKAVELDKQYAAARLRLGVMQTRTGLVPEGLASIDEAIRLYRLSGRTEGEAEALLRKGIALSTRRRFGEATEALHAVTEFGLAPRYASQRIRAQLELARVAIFGGRLDEAQSLAEKSISEAPAAGVGALAATGYFSLGTACLSLGQYRQAEPALAKAIDLAAARGAARTEMRARLQLASTKLSLDLPADALELAAGPLRYFSDAGEAGLTTEAKLVTSRAQAMLGQYADAERLTAELIRTAETDKLNATLTQALETQDIIATDLGRLPEGLALRERIEAINRQEKNLSALPRDLTNRIERLILLGRAADAAPVFKEVEDAMAAKSQPYVLRRSRIALLRAQQASVERRFADVGRPATIASDPALNPPAGTLIRARILGEHANAELGRSRTPAATIAAWADEPRLAPERREASCGVAQILLARREFAMALALLTRVLADPVAQQNAELGWRLAALGALAARGAGNDAEAKRLTTLARTQSDAISKAWGAASAAYFARPDLARLRERIR